MTSLAKLDVTKVGEKTSDTKDMEDIKVVFELPNGKKDALSFRGDLTIGYMKLQLQTKHNLPYSKQEFSLEGKRVMDDPMSLNDYHSDAKTTANVKVSLVESREEGDDDKDEKPGEEEEDLDDVDLLDEDD